jgi:hypothetical protein
MQIPNESGLLFRTDLNAALLAIVQNSSGNTEPSTKYPFQFWVDTSGASPILKIRSADNSSWITVGQPGVANFGHLPLTGGVLSGAISFSNTDAMSVPVGTTVQRPGSPTAGMIRLNSDSSLIEIYTGSSWVSLFSLSQTDFTIVNNQSTAANITGLSFSSASVKSAIIEYFAQRITTSTGAVELVETGSLIASYLPTSNTWQITRLPSDGDVGLTFSITAGGQVQYTSTNITGTASISKFSFRVRTMAG